MRSKQLDLGNGTILNFVHKPFIAFVKDDIGWGGKSNLTDKPSRNSEIQIYDLEEARFAVKGWSETDEEYKCGYIVDFENKTVYYDTDESIEHLEKKRSQYFPFIEKKIKVNSWDEVPIS